MKTASVSEIKSALSNLPQDELLDICLKLVKYKKENKELLNYLLFESQDEQAYIVLIKNEINNLFEEVNTSNLYFAKKTIRNILRLTTKYCRHSGSKQVEVELLLHFCTVLKDSGIPMKNSTALHNIYFSQIKKLEKLLADLHEDLQYDYKKSMNHLY